MLIYSGLENYIRHPNDINNAVSWLRFLIRYSNQIGLILMSNKILKSKRQNDSEYEVKVVTINGRYHARVYFHDEVIDEMACEEQCDIGYICRSMLRMVDKCGGDSFTNAARDRLFADKNAPVEARGRIWTYNQLQAMKEKRNARLD